MCIRCSVHYFHGSVSGLTIFTLLRLSLEGQTSNHRCLASFSSPVIGVRLRFLCSCTVVNILGRTRSACCLRCVASVHFDPTISRRRKNFPTISLEHLHMPLDHFTFLLLRYFLLSLLERLAYRTFSLSLGRQASITYMCTKSEFAMASLVFFLVRSVSRLLL